MQPSAPAHDLDQRVYLRLSWPDFERFLELRGDAAGTRITYLDGLLEIMSPSSMHEGIKKRLARLLELWAAHEDVALAAYGSTTLKRRPGKAGVEPDECYVVGRSELDGPPDLAIEVNQTSGSIDKLDVYHRLGVPEVWVWEDGQLRIFVRRAGGYARRQKSSVLPSLDVPFFTRFVSDPDQVRAVRAFMAALRKN